MRPIEKIVKKQGFFTGKYGSIYDKAIFCKGLLYFHHFDYDDLCQEIIAIYLDANFSNWKYPKYKGVVSALKRTLYAKYGLEYMIEYAKQFWLIFHDNKKMIRIHINEENEEALEFANYFVALFELVKYFFDNNFLEDIFMFKVSVHGNHILVSWAIIRKNDYPIKSTFVTLFFVNPNNEKLYKKGLYDFILKN